VVRVFYIRYAYASSHADRHSDSRQDFQITFIFFAFEIEFLKRDRKSVCYFSAEDRDIILLFDS
jgi:hypothetical protein